MMNKRSITLLIIALAASNYVSAADLTITHYNPGENALFPASSVLVSGEKTDLTLQKQTDSKITLYMTEPQTIIIQQRNDTTQTVSV